MLQYSIFKVLQFFHIPITVLHIFMVPTSAAFCICSVIVLIRSCSKFSFFKFSSKLFGTAAIVMMTVSYLYLLCTHCMLVMSGMYFFCLSWYAFLRFVSKGTMISTIWHSRLSECQMMMSGLFFSIFVIVRICSSHQISI